ncbi:MAG: hypothetical protein M3410_18155 [Acidobacteriota bacterium]|nr:hypothetical protein [Acidobacteriota bacterium]
METIPTYSQRQVINRPDKQQPKAKNRGLSGQINHTEAQSRTDENLRNLIAGVDRYFTEGRSGN